MAPGRRIFSMAVNVYGRVFNWMETKWAASHPPTYRVYRLFKGGLQVTFTDFSRFVGARRRLLEGQGLGSLSARELDALGRVPRDMLRLAPVLVVAILPASFLFLPIFYMFPRRLLTARFWSAAQRRQFESEDAHRRRSVFPRMSERLAKRTSDAGLQNVVSELRRGQPVDSDQVAALSPAFLEKRLQLAHLSRLHLETLCRCHVCRNSPLFLRSRLQTLARVMHHQDRALMSEGLETFQRHEKEDLCLHRGVQPFDLTEAEMDEFLTRWCSVSNRLDIKDLSFILHLPPLLAQHWPPTDPPVEAPAASADSNEAKGGADRPAAGS